MTTTPTPRARRGAVVSDALGRHRTVAAATLALAGLLFVLYPAVRPFSDEASLEGAAAFASAAWVVSHTLAMAAFALLVVGLLALHAHLGDTAARRSSRPGVVLAGVGVTLTLPYYGAETFGLRAIGTEALELGDPALLELAEAVRYGPGIAFIGLGLLLLAAGTVLLAVAVWRAGRLPRWSGLPLAAGIVLYLPQFLTPQPVRVLHGMLMAAGCATLAVAVRGLGAVTAPRARPR